MGRQPLCNKENWWLAGDYVDLFMFFTLFVNSCRDQLGMQHSLLSLTSQLHRSPCGREVAAKQSQSQTDWQMFANNFHLT